MFNLEEGFKIKQYETTDFMVLMGKTDCYEKFSEGSSYYLKINDNNTTKYIKLFNENFEPINDFKPNKPLPDTPYNKSKNKKSKEDNYMTVRDDLEREIKENNE